MNKNYPVPIWNGINIKKVINMTENEMRKALGLKKIWDCGLIKYVWKCE